jgi:hypothetical protein
MTEEELNSLKADAERYRFLRLESRIDKFYRRGLPRSGAYLIDFPTIPAGPTNEGVDYRSNFDASVDAAMEQSSLLARALANKGKPVNVEAWAAKLAADVAELND